MKPSARTLGIACLPVLLSPAWAASDAETSLWTRDRLAGDLFGGRSALGAHGMDLRLEATHFYQGDVAGSGPDEFELGGEVDLFFAMDFAYKGGKGEAGKGADITLSIDGKKVANASMDATVGGRFGIDTFGIGEDSGQPVTHHYKPAFKFTGEIGKVVVEVK